MEMQTIYTGSFRSRDGVLYRVDILSSDTSTVAEDVAFGEAPVQISWSEVDKLDPVQGSCLTLQLNSLRDRQFFGLYTVEAGKVRVDVYRNDVLYWSGSLDTELYEEPYSMKQDYDVSFSFSDFAILDRLRWNHTGISTVEEIIQACIDASGVQYRGIKKYISTKTANDGETINLSELYVLNDNFYDEDGEAMTMRQVLEEVLRPFALRLVQKGGYLYLYDLNCIYDTLPVERVWWQDTDAYLSVDKVYNNVKVTFSPYAEAEIFDGTLDPANVLPDPEASRIFAIEYRPERMGAGFTFNVGGQDGLPLILMNGAKFFRIDGGASGEDSAGVVWAYRGSAESDHDTVMLNSFSKAMQNGKCVSKPIFKTQMPFVGYETGAHQYYNIKITLDLLFDVRYNPFEDASGRNNSDEWSNLKDWCNFGYVPAMLYVKDKDGNILKHYRNSNVMNSDGYSAKGSWLSGPGNWGDMFLCFYDYDDRKSASGFGGWKANKQIIGYFRDELPAAWKEDGELVPVPTVGGFLELQIGSGIYQFDYKREEKNIYSKARWLMYRNPTMTIVDSKGVEIKLNDVQDTAWLNKNAMEGLNIDTILGTIVFKTSSNPRSIIRHNSISARGLLRTSDMAAYKRFSRAGVEDRPERLLIATAYSQYGTRHNSLSGTARLLPDMRVCTDASITGKYIILSEVQDLFDDTSEIKMVELSADSYEGLEYE